MERQKINPFLSFIVRRNSPHVFPNVFKLRRLVPHRGTEKEIAFYVRLIPFRHLTLQEAFTSRYRVPTGRQGLRLPLFYQYFVPTGRILLIGSKHCPVRGKILVELERLKNRRLMKKLSDQHDALRLSVACLPQGRDTEYAIPNIMTLADSVALFKFLNLADANILQTM